MSWLSRLPGICPHDIWHTGLLAALLFCIYVRPSYAGMMMMWGLMLLQYLVSTSGQQGRSQAPLYLSPPCTRRPAQLQGGLGSACPGVELCIRHSCQEGKGIFAPLQGCVKAKKGRRTSSVPCITLVCCFCLEQSSQEQILGPK